MPYFLIWCSDGETRIQPINPATFVQELNDGDYEGAEFLAALPKTLGDSSDPAYWPEGAHLIIRGEIVTPQAVEVVKEYRLE